MVTHKIIRYAALAVTFVFVCSGIANCQTQVISPFVAAPAAAAPPAGITLKDSANKSEDSGGPYTGFPMTISSGADFLIVGVGSRKDSHSGVDSVKWGTQKLAIGTQSKSQSYDGHYSYVWYLASPTVATDSIRVYYSGTYTTSHVGALTFSGCNSTYRADADTQNSASGYALPITVTSSTSDYVLNWIYYRDNGGGSIAIGSGESYIQSLTARGGRYAYWLTKAADASATTFTETATGSVTLMMNAVSLRTP